MEPGDVLEGFRLLRSQNIAEISATAFFFQHVKTNAEVISVKAADENKTFGVVFRTPPKDSTGVAHVMEHSVLCGSRKYPIKEPFVELLKSSMQTFLNALTYPDRTCYPVASCNLQDFYNLVDVYLDAVFYPRAVNNPKILEQEGWHYECDNPEEALTFKGVVFNEMKGVYSDPDAVQGRGVYRLLFPDNAYSVDSGGDPAEIPDLNFEAFKAFHSRFYHPSNGKFWFYGDDDLDTRLRLLRPYLDGFEMTDPQSEVAPQPLLSTLPGQDASGKVFSTFAVGEDSQDEAKTMVSVNWLMTEGVPDLQTGLALSFLNFLLLGTRASPLHQALMDSGLGSAIIGGGMDDDLIQATFSIGLKGVADEGAADEVVKIVQEVLETHAEKGFTDDAIQAAVNTIEFSLRENNTGSFPRGLSLLFRIVPAWIYGLDPLQRLSFSKPLAELKSKLAAREPVFQDLIKRHLLQNQHRVVQVVCPSTTLAKETEQKEKDRLAAHKATLSPQQLTDLIQDCATLRTTQETPDPPEALATVPALSLGDIPVQTQTIPIDVAHRDYGVRVVSHDIFTSGVIYLAAGFDLSCLTLAELPYLSLFARAIKEFGTQAEGPVTLSQRIGKNTGGVWTSTLITGTMPDLEGPDGSAAAIAAAHNPELVSYLFLKGKCTSDQTADMLAIMRDIGLTASLDNKDKFLTLVRESKAGMEAAVVNSGHSVAASHLSSQYSVLGWLGELRGGLTHYKFLCELEHKVANDWPAVLAVLQGMQNKVFTRRGMLFNCTTDSTCLQRTDPLLTDFASSFQPGPEPETNSWLPPNGLTPTSPQGFAVPTQVNYVGKAVNLYQHGYTFDASAFVVDHYLQTTWLWDRVRVSGGAYGAMSSFDFHSGVFKTLSYRDPNLQATLHNFDGCGQFLKELQLGTDTTHKSIIGTIGSMDQYQLPDSKGESSLMRYLLKDSEELRQKRRDQVFATSEKSFHQFGEAILSLANEGSEAAVASHEAFQEANAERSASAQFDVRSVLSTSNGDM